jgi:hypothetical protein
MSRSTNEASGRRNRPGPVRAARDERGARDELTSSRIEALLDEGLALTFPASDPVALPLPGGGRARDI